MQQRAQRLIVRGHRYPRLVGQETR